MNGLTITFYLIILENRCKVTTFFSFTERFTEKNRLFVEQIWLLRVIFLPLQQKTTKNESIMKQSLMTTLLLVGTISASSATYEYMVFETGDGAKQSMTANGLKLVYKDGILTATNGDISKTFTVSALSRMFFSNTKEGDDVTSISVATVSDLEDTDVEIYDLSGRRLPQGTKPQKGLYIFKKGNTTTKKYVK